MSKITAFLATVGLMLVSLAMQAQPTFTFSPSDPMPPLGAQITVDVVVDDFTDITSYQYSVNWNPSHFSYVSISNFNGDLGLGAGNFGTTMTGSGKLTTLWSDPMASPQSIPNGSILFTITLDVVAASAVSTDIQFTNDPTAQEVTQDTGSGIMDITGSVTFTDTTIDIDGGGGGGGGPTCTFSGFGLLVDSDSAATGDQFCLNVSTCNFTDIVSMQYTMQFNPNLLQFDNVGNFNLQNLNGGAFGTTNAGQGFITVSWFDSLGAGVTLPNETPIYEICFTAIGAGGEMDTVAINGALAPIEVTDVASGGANIGLESVDGEVLITGTAGSAVTVFAECEAGDQGDTIYVDVSVRNFNDMLGLQYSMGWDPTVVEFYETVWTGALPGSPTFNTSPALVDAGKLTFLWSDPFVTGVTVADSTVIYQIGYIVVGDVAEMTAINFTDDPTAIEATQDNMGSPEVVPLARIPGKVEVTFDVTGIFNLILNDVTACTGDTINVPVTVAGFDSIISMQYDVRWSPGQLDYLGLNGYDLSGLNNGSFNQLNDSTLRCAWVEPVLNPQTKPDGDTIYNMQFVVLGPDSSTADILILDDPPMHLVEISDLDGVISPYLTTNGLITVSCVGGVPIEVTDTLITNVLCNGDATGAIDITVSGGNGSFTYSWSNGPSTEDITGLTAGDYTVTISSGGQTEIQTYTVTEPAELTATTSATDATCNGDNDGTAEVTPSGGTSPYTYIWDNAGETTQSISGLTAGTYTVTVTDANMCTVAVMATVGEPDALVINTSFTPVSCNGGDDGTATATPSGGTPAYSYTWGGLPDTTPTITGLTAGSYSVTVTDDNGCTAVTIIDVTEPMVLTASATATDVTCNGDTDGSTTLTVNGGTSPYIYDWDFDGTGDTDDPQNLNNVPPDVYNVTVTDANGCTATASATVGEPAPVTATAVIMHESAVDADDGEIDITATGGTGPYTYDWGAQGMSEDLTGLAPGTYTVTITDANGCTGVESFEVFEFAAPDITIDNVSDVTCNGGSDGSIEITISGGTPPYVMIDWSPSGTGEDPTGLSPGIYTVTVTDNAGVTATASATINEPAAISITMDASTDVTCNGDADGSIQMTTSGGTPNLTYDWGGGLNTEDISGLTGGTYVLTVTDGNGCTATSNSIVIDEPAPLSISLVSTTDPNCNGETSGAIDISVSGGTPTYTYVWSMGAGTSEDLVGLLAGTYTVTVTDSRGCTVVSNPITLTEPPAIVVNSFAGMVSCNGLSDGFIDLTVTGGSGSYTSYAWNPSLPNQEDQPNLPAGSYTVTVTDSDNCTVVAGPIAVTQPAPLSISSDVTNASASNDDGAINITVTGGTPSYTYNWNTGATTMDLNGIPSGCYAITVTDGNGCVVEDSIKVGGTIVVTSVITNVSCNGGEDGAIDITVSGGIQPYTYVWEPGPDVEDLNGLSIGTYCVTVMDSNSSVAAECYTIEEPDALTILSSTVTDETGLGCNGGIDLEIIGGTPGYSFQWNNGSTSEDLINVCKGDYDVVITDANGCILISNTFTVAPPPLVITDTDPTPVSCFGGTDGSHCVSILGGCGPYKFTLLSTGQEIISTSGEACFGNLPAGPQTITIMDSGSPVQVLAHNFTVNEPGELIINVENIINNTDPTGNNCNGVINTNTVGGTGPYTYQWSHNGSINNPDVGGLCEDLSPYCVTVTDANGCSAELCDINVELGLSIVVENVDDVSCMDDCDGTINITVYGGAAPYSYSWDNGAGTGADPSGLCPGNYSVTVVDANLDVVIMQGITIAQPLNALSVSDTIYTQPINNGSNGAINITPSGGWGGYSYQWSNGATSQDIGGAAEGTYTVTITDANGCQQIETYDLGAIRLSLDFEIAEPSCNGDNDGFIEVFVEGGSGNYTYVWSSPHNTSLAFDLSAGEYSLTVTDQSIPGLSATETITLGEPDRLVVTIECFENNGLQAVVQGGTEPYSYLWNTPGTDTLPIVPNLPPGTYGVRVEDANNCVTIGQADSGDCIDSECFDAREIISVNGDGLNDVFIISCAESYNNTLRVFNRWGQMVFEATNYDNSWMGTDQDGNELPEDGYFYVLEYEEGGETIQIKGAITVLR